MQHDGDTVSVTLPSGGGGGGTQVNADWDATSGLAEILNKPDLSSLFSGISGITGNTLTFDQFGGGTASVNLPNDNDNDYVDSFVATLAGQALTMTLGRTGSLIDLAQTVTLPAGGGGWGDGPRRRPRAHRHAQPEHRQRRLPTSPCRSRLKGSLLQGNADRRRRDRGHADFLGDEFLDLPELAATPTTDDGALILDMGGEARSRLRPTSSCGCGPARSETIFYVQKSRTDSLTLRIYKINYAYTTQNRQRVEGVVFNAVPSTTTELQIQTISSAGVVLEFGTGATEMITAVPGANTFMIARAGVYMMEWVAVITPNEARPEPCLQILNNADNTLLGQIDPTYIRFTAAGTYHVRRAGPVIIPEDNMVVRALVENCRSDNAFSVAGGHQLNFIRGALGAKGEPGTGGGGGGSGMTPSIGRPSATPIACPTTSTGSTSSPA